MPLRPLRPCKAMGCRALTRDAKGYCVDHVDKAQEQQSEYGCGRSGARETMFYKSGAWLRIRVLALRRDNGMCQHCLRDGKITFASLVHHIIEIRVNWLLRLTLGNLISLCDSCHNKIHKGGRK